jgi:hypothetical protein
MKICSKCKIQKDVSNFYKSKSSNDGLYNVCKECDKKRCLEYYKSNSEYIIKKKKEYTEENSESVKEYQNQYRSENKDKLKLNRELNKVYFKNWWSENKEKSSLYGKRYRVKYPHVKACRNVLRSCINRMGLTKESSTFELLKYTPENFKNHIESLFIDGMSWENYGKWHIDHIIPISKFDKNTPLSTINSLDNLQPLWALDNLSKSNKI